MLHPIKMSDVARFTVFFVVILSRLLNINGKHHAPGILDKNNPSNSKTIFPLYIAMNTFDRIKKPIPKYIVLFPKVRLTAPKINPAAIPNIGIKAK